VAAHSRGVGFTILLLGFLFQQGASLAHDVTRVLQLSIGERAQRYVDVATRAVRAAVSSMLVVGLFDGVATACAYAIAGARVLMGCIGGFGVLGLAGLVIGPVVLSLAREVWEQRVRELASRSRAC